MHPTIPLFTDYNGKISSALCSASDRYYAADKIA